MDCLLCQRKIKESTFESLLTLQLRYFCSQCEQNFVPKFKIENHQVVCFEENEAMNEFIDRLNRGDIILCEGLLELLSRYGYFTFKAYNIATVDKSKLNDEVHAILSEQLIRFSKHKKTNLKLVLF